MTAAARATARVPGSKSITARALALAALADGTSRLTDPLVADDTFAFAGGLVALGFPVERDPGVWTVVGDPAGPPAASGSVWCHDAGTASRFLPAVASLGHGRYRLDASQQMRARPMAPLLGALRQLGVRVEAAAGDRMPLEIDARGIAGGRVVLDAGVSSQYLTALCLIGPATHDGLEIEVTGLVSRPYVELTIGMMREFGAEVEQRGATIVVGPGGYRARDYPIEPDASAASYFFAAAAVTGNTVTVPGLGRGSLQGDLRFATEVLAAMGCEVVSDDRQTTVTGPAKLTSPGEVVMRDISDTMMTMAAIAPFADGPVRIVDIANCRVKECDRIDAMSVALTANGITTRTGPDWLEVVPGTPRPAPVATRSDHRIAMAMTVFGLRTGGVTLDDPGCVAKTFPGFHTALADTVDAWSADQA